MFTNGLTMKNKGYVEKAWGYELIWATNDLYCGKLMVFAKPGAKSSMHFHKNKDETWFVNAGQFMLRYIDTKTGEQKEMLIKEGDTWNNPPLQPHQLEALQPNSIIFEVSTADDTDDTYRLTTSTSPSK